MTSLSRRERATWNLIKRYTYLQTFTFIWEIKNKRRVLYTARVIIKTILHYLLFFSIQDTDSSRRAFKNLSALRRKQVTQIFNDKNAKQSPIISIGSNKNTYPNETAKCIMHVRDKGTCWEMRAQHGNIKITLGKRWRYKVKRFGYLLSVLIKTHLRLFVKVRAMLYPLNCLWWQLKHWAFSTYKNTFRIKILGSLRCLIVRNEIRQPMYAQRHTEARSRNHCCRGNARRITHSNRVSRSIVIQHAQNTAVF
jgi:hypothetical protein